MGRLLRSGRVQVAFVVLAAGIFFCGNFPLHAENVIRSIEIEGNLRIEDQTVISFLKVGVGDSFDESLINQSLKALFDTGLYSDISITPSGDTLVVSLIENPTVNKVVFEGNKKFDDDTLASELRIKPRRVFTPARVQSDVQRIITLYRRAGRFSAKIEPKIIKQDRNRVDLVFEINEGPITEISRINFVGNHLFSDWALREVVKTAEQTWWGRLMSSGDTYDPDKLNFDRELLRRHYLKNGYADFRVISAVAELDREQEHFFITFTVDEGEQYRFGKIHIDSTLSSLSVDELEPHILTFEGDIYNVELLDDTVDGITSGAAEHGFSFVKVRPRPKRDPASGTISITFLLDDGPRVYIERIDIVGNQRTLDYVIRREFRLVEGDAFNPTLLRKARTNILSLGFFKDVKIDSEDGSSADRVLVKVEVEEKSTGEFSFGAGYSSIEQVIGEVSITERNLMGRGQYVRLGGTLGGSTKTVDFAFTEPHFLDSPVSFGFDIFSIESDSTDTSSYKSDDNGVRLRLGLPLQEDLDLGLRYSFINKSVYGIPDTASAAVKQTEGERDQSSIGYNLIYNTLDHPSHPKSGVKMTLDQSFAGVGGDVKYMRSSVDAVYFKNLGSDYIGSVRGSAGNIFGWDGHDIEIGDAFHKGPELVRGFKVGGIGPRDLTTDDALGGKTFAGASLEVIFPIGFSDDLGVRAAVFADAGTVFDSDINIADLIVLNSPDIRASVGAGILWESPIGPLRFDISEALLSETFDKKEMFRFSGAKKF